MSALRMPRTPIGGLVEKVISWNPVRDAPGDELAYIDLSAVDNATKVVTGFQSILGREAPSRARQRVKGGDILVSTVRPNLNGVARVPDDLDEATASTGFCVLRPMSAKLDTSYLFHWVQSSDFIDDMVRKATGASYPAVSDKIIALSEIPLPPPDQQKRIAAILDQADELRRKRQRAIDRLDQLGQAIFYEMFGEWDGEGSDIDTLKLGDHLDFLTSGSRGWAEYYRDKGGLFLRIQNVRRDELALDDVAYVEAPESAEAKRTRVEPGDVLLSITADLGRTAVVPNDIGEAYINQHLAIIRSRAFNPRFLSAALSSPAGQRGILKRNREGVKAGLNFDDIRSVSIPKVSTDMQDIFAKRLGFVDTLKRDQCERASR